MQSLRNAIVNHRHFLIVVTILIVAMTWPTILYVFRTDVFWLPIDSGDIWIEFWNAWYGKLLISGEAHLSHTDLSFYPKGVSLAFHYFNLAHMVVFGSLQLLIPASNAFNLSYLLIIFTASLSAYIYLNYLFNDKWISLFGAVVFGCSGYVVGRPMHPGVAILVTVPLSLYFLHRGVLESRRSLALISGLLVGATAFIGLYIFVCLVLTVCGYVLYFALTNGRDKRFWLSIAVVVVVIGIAGAVRVYPMLTDDRALDSILKKSGVLEHENDLLQNFINYENPLYNRLITNRVTSAFVKLPDPGRWNTSYLGYVPLLLIGIGVVDHRHRKRMLPWAILMACFLLLRLGSILTINGHEIAGFLLPKHYLDELIPVVFEAFYSTDHFQIGALFPLAVLSSFGLLVLLQRVPESRRTWPVLILIALLAVEYYRSPPQTRIVADEETAFLDWLASENDQDIVLINLPMNRGNSKTYLFYQTLTGYPQAEGLATRTPPEAYDYIRSNLLLGTWRNKDSIVCAEANRGAYLSALDQLNRDGFTHIVLHYRLIRQETVADSFAAIEPAYQDDFVAIYRLRDLRESCP